MSILLTTELTAERIKFGCMHSELLKQDRSCIIVDDDEIDRLTVQAFLRNYPFITVAATFESPVAALEQTKSLKPDILFLDVDMPDMNGLSLRRHLLDIPVCIFITAYPEHALEAFETQALDFLVKPINHDRFAQTIHRVQEFLLLRTQASLLQQAIGPDTIFIKEGHEEVKIQMHEILYLEAMKDYTAVLTHKRKYLVSTPMGTLIQAKPFDKFVRIHRSFSVPKHSIKKIGAEELELDNSIRLPIGRTFRDSLSNIKP